MIVRFSKLCLLTSKIGLFGFLASHCCLADQIILKTGGILTGKIFPSKEDGTVVIRSDDGIAFQFSKSDIAKELKSTALSLDYESVLKETPDTAKGNKEIGVKCRTGSMSELGKAHFERVVELDPDDKSAWAFIGHIYDERYGGWIRRSEQNFREGKDEHEGDTMTLHSKALITTKEKARFDKASLERQIKLEVAKIKKGSKDSVSAMDFLQRVDNPAVIEYLEKQLMEELASNGNPGIYMQMLLQMPGITATQTFLRLSMNTSLPEGPGTIVDKSVEALGRYELSRDIATRYYLAALQSDPKKSYSSRLEFQAVVVRIDRAAQNLQTIQSESTTINISPIPQLIDSLITYGTVVSQKTQNQGVDGGGGTAFSSGGTVSNAISQNQQGVLSALQVITGENHSFNRDAWRFWYAQKYAKTNLDLRRIE